MTEEEMTEEEKVESIARAIIQGLGVPEEFIRGSISYSGSDIALKILDEKTRVRAEKVKKRLFELLAGKGQDNGSR